MAKRYKRSFFSRKTKRASERHLRGGTVTVVGSNVVAYMYEASDPCTICNAVLDISMIEDNDVVRNDSMYYALVYIPEGYDVNSLSGGIANDMYNPTKNVLIAGALGQPSGVVVKRSYTSRKLASRDRIGLIVQGGAVGYEAKARWTLQFTTLH